MFPANILPGQEFKEFTVYRQKSGLTGTGRPQNIGLKPTDITFYGILVGASQKEKEQWKQNGHPITHKIIEYSAEGRAKATDYLVLESEREFYVQGRKNPGELNVTIIYYVEERFDLKRND